MDFSDIQPGGPEDRHGGSSGCTECAAPLADDQRYCLHCGARRGAPRVDALAELGLVGIAPFGVQAAVLAATEAAPATGARRVSRPLAVVLATLALTVGGALGATIHGPASSLAAATPQAGPIVLVSANAPTAAPVAAADEAADIDDGSSFDDASSGGGGGGDRGFVDD